MTLLIEKLLIWFESKEITSVLVTTENITLILEIWRQSSLLPVAFGDTTMKAINIFYNLFFCVKPKEVNLNLYVYQQV
jgi:hypothetical protein